MKRFLFTSIAMLFFTQLMTLQSQCDPLVYNSNDVFLSLGFSCALEDETSASFYKFNRVAIITDGSMLISDDYADAIYRVYHEE